MNKIIDFLKSEKFAFYAKEAGLGLVSLITGFAVWLILSL